jgi:hypothetical protein
MDWPTLHHRLSQAPVKAAVVLAAGLLLLVLAFFQPLLVLALAAVVALGIHQRLHHDLAEAVTVHLDNAKIVRDLDGDTPPDA